LSESVLLEFAGMVLLCRNNATIINAHIKAGSNTGSDSLTRDPTRPGQSRWPGNPWPGSTSDACNQQYPSFQEESVNFLFSKFYDSAWYYRCLLWLLYGIGQTIIFLPCVFFPFFFFFYSRLISAAANWTSTILLHMVWP